jgi:squalene-associated FAD-dependent desaturase
MSKKFMSNATVINNTINLQVPNTQHITIIGAGWAGLTCAYELLKRNLNVTILEAAPQAGGRARSVRWGKNIIDNGQHLFIRGYQHTLNLLNEISPNSNHFTETPFQIIAKDTNNTLEFKILHNKFMPYYVNLLFSLILSKYFSFKDKLKLLKFFTTLIINKFTIPHDMSVHELLTNNKFSPQIIQNFFQPIVISTMTTKMNLASARIFLNILQQTFFTKPEYSNLLFSKTNLTTLLVQPLVAQILALGGKIEYTTNVKNIAQNPINAQQIQIYTNRQEHALPTELLVLATPPWQTSKLIDSIPALKDLQSQLNNFNCEAITSIYLEFAAPLDLSTNMLGLINNSAHWIFKHSAGNPNIACVVISSSADLIKQQVLTKEEIVAEVLAEIQQVCQLPAIINTKYIHEKRAAFACTVAANQIRPRNQTIIPNVFIAGDYTTHAYPATLEGAVLSGKLAAGAILDYLSNK